MNDKDYWLENMLDGFFAQERQKERSNFWSNREPKQRITKQERDTINVLNSFIPAINKAPAKECASTNNKPPRRRLGSGNVTAQ
ncbi:hypothetical protein [Xenorhabdus szentirmaii]|uniref:hypothetical protein n=1 Tax=Xenorhabdus szentirmaii TaxID=290112 RepID=UPI000C048A18|nr:hypothetical protein [Xenorhabdus szentirmaii]PHM42377.1 hypothetical protein Xszus_02111 [Xenorhabdus szentirmaii]